MARAELLAARQGELLPVPYFHVVFTLPQQIGGLALQNAREIYSILFRAASETLLTIAADPKRLGAEIGFLAVLHTWGQNTRSSERHRDTIPHLSAKSIPRGQTEVPRGRMWSRKRRMNSIASRVMTLLLLPSAVGVSPPRQDSS